MTVFFIYSPDGAPQEPTELECAANLAVPEYQFRRRVKDGQGESTFVSELPEGETRVNERSCRSLTREEEWPQATKDARMWVWWRYVDQGIPDVLREAAEEVWSFTQDGGIDRQRFNGPDVRARMNGSGR